MENSQVISKNHVYLNRIIKSLMIVLLGIFYLLSVFGACSNQDIMAIFALLAFPISVFLIIRRRFFSVFWVLFPFISYFIGRPFGHNYGSMTRSDIFGLSQGSQCQQSNFISILIALIVISAIANYIFYLVSINPSVKKWVAGLLIAIVSSLIVAGITGTWNPSKTFSLLFPGYFEGNKQEALAYEFAEKYRFFSLGKKRWNRPTSGGFPNQFKKLDNIVYDKATGLFWQSGGSKDSMGFSSISGYIRTLNEKKLGGYSDWRLPSLVEAWTILKNRKNKENLYIDSIFIQRQSWIWTSSVASNGYGWFMMFKYGYPLYQNAWGSHAFIRAVRGEEFQ